MTLTDPNDSLERQNEKLTQIVEALIRRVEYGQGQTGAAYAQFEKAALLEQSVRDRTVELEQALELLRTTNLKLSEANQQTEAARRDLANAIETVSEGFALFDPDGRLTMYNSKFCKLFRDVQTHLRRGLQFSDYVEKVSTSRYLALPGDQSPQDWAQQRLSRHKETQVIFNVSLTRDRWLQVSEHRTPDGETVVVQTDVTDILRFERAERQKLKDSQTQLIRATLDHLEQGVAIFDHDNNLVGWNARIAEMLSFSARNIFLGAKFERLSQHLDENTFFTSDFTQKQLFSWTRLKGGRENITFELSHKKSRILQGFGASLPDRGFLIAITDVTQERHASRRLHDLNEKLEQRVRNRTLELEDALSIAERANATKSRFVAAASHDLQQPLSAAKLYVSTLLQHVDHPETRIVLSKTSSALEGVSQIIDALMDISNLEGEALQLNFAVLRLDDVLRPVIDEMDGIATQKGLTLTYRGSHLRIRSDANYLRRIVRNLLANAIRYTSSGRVLVAVRQRGKYARIEVWDTGAGIATEDQMSIFDEFRRLPSGAGKDSGLGLGLAIVERACARLSHPLEVCSRLGRGSCFQVSVPITPENHLSDQSGNGFKGQIVMVVESDLHQRQTLAVKLEIWGLDVLQAEDAFSAQTLLGDLGIAPDAVLLDGSSAMDVFTPHIQSNPFQSLAAVPCAIMADLSLYQSAAALSQSPLVHLPKPMAQDALLRFLNQAVPRSMPKP